MTPPMIELTGTPIRAVLFDWGNTLMRDLPGQHGPMRDWPHVEALPGALEALEALHAQGLRLALATNAADSGPAAIRAPGARGAHHLDGRGAARRRDAPSRPDPHRPHPPDPRAPRRHRLPEELPATHPAQRLV